MSYEEIAACRSRGSANLDQVLDLGVQCVSDFVAQGSPDGCTHQPDRAPLVLVRCQDCTLVQLRHTVDRERLYRRYWYRSGTNESMVAALKDVVAEATRQVKLGLDDVVLDVGCNDGTLLDFYPRDDVLTIGFEPSQKLADVAADKGHGIIAEFFPPPGSWRNWLERQPKIITSIAMLYSLDDPNAFCAAIKDWLHPEGIWVLQLQDLHAMVACNGFDNICHEHLEYYSLRSLRHLLGRHGLKIASASYNNVNGGSLRVIVCHGPVCVPAIADRHLAHVETIRMQGFAEAVEGLKRGTLAYLEYLKREGKLCLGYGASTKGNTLLQYYGIGPELVSAIADRNPEKWSRQTVGTNIPIISEDEMRVARPDYLFCLPWHFMDSFRKRESDFLARGGLFVQPLPHLTIVGGDIHAYVHSPEFAPAFGAGLA